jgi:phage regulator Rha-like protein
LGGKGRRISEFKASLVYRVRSMTARAIQRNPVSKKAKKKKKKKRKKERKEIWQKNAKTGLIQDNY